MESLSRTLVIAGIVLVAAGLLLSLGPGVPLLGRLPGDIRIERPGFRFFFPLTSSLLISAVLSAALWLFAKLR